MSQPTVWTVVGACTRQGSGAREALVTDALDGQGGSFSLCFQPSVFMKGEGSV